jgi:DNA repair protein RadA/Sms
MAVASACREVPVSKRTVWLGEVGLGGELRAVGQVNERLAEARKLGFVRAVVPRAAQKGLRAPQGLDVLTPATVSEALEYTKKG